MRSRAVVRVASGSCAATRTSRTPARRVRSRPGAKGRTRTISRFFRWTRTAAFYAVTFAVVAAGAVWLALRVAPLQTVSAAGQTAQVGATLPNASLHGPGELDLFGEVMATKPNFP
ncbi:MAG TPA: hypothetical protein VGD91_27375, partial [Trebonia sp.]